jgi:hypothetical protein
LWRVQIMNKLIMQFSPSSCRFNTVPLSSLNRTGSVQWRTELVFGRHRYPETRHLETGHRGRPHVTPRTNYRSWSTLWVMWRLPTDTASSNNTLINHVVRGATPRHGPGLSDERSIRGKQPLATGPVWAWRCGGFQKENVIRQPGNKLVTGGFTLLWQVASRDATRRVVLTPELHCVGRHNGSRFTL